VVDDEPDVEALFRQHFRRDLRSGRLRMEFAMSAADALARVARASEGSLILILSDINMPRMTGLEMPPNVKALRPGACHHDHRLLRSPDQAPGDRRRGRPAADQADRLCDAEGRDGRLDGMTK
jgi:CheY-like chemotaxis protein